MRSKSCIIRLSYVVITMFSFTGCMNPKVIRPINSQSEENLANMSINVQIINDTYLPVLNAYLDFKIQQMKAKKQNELSGADFKLTPEAKIELEFYVRDLQVEKKEILELLQELLGTVKEQTEIAKLHLDAYKNFAENGKITDRLAENLLDSNLQLKALSALKMDNNKAKRLQELLSLFQ